MAEFSIRLKLIQRYELHMTKILLPPSHMPYKKKKDKKRKEKKRKYKQESPRIKSKISLKQWA